MLIRFESLKKFQLIWDDVKVTDTDDGGSHPNAVWLHNGLNYQKYYYCKI